MLHFLWQAYTMDLNLIPVKEFYIKYVMYGFANVIRLYNYRGIWCKNMASMNASTYDYRLLL